MRVQSQEPEQVDDVEKIRKDLDDTHDTLHKTISDLMVRGEKLEVSLERRIAIHLYVSHPSISIYLVGFGERLGRFGHVLQTIHEQSRRFEQLLFVVVNKRTSSIAHFVIFLFICCVLV